MYAIQETQTSKGLSQGMSLCSLVTHIHGNLIYKNVVFMSTFEANYIIALEACKKVLRFACLEGELEI